VKPVHRYFSSLYRRTMREAYRFAGDAIASSLRGGGKVLDCGANEGAMVEVLSRRLPQFQPGDYHGVEWSLPSVQAAREKGRNVVHADLNHNLPFADGSFRCVFGLSVLEHLLNGCRFIREAHRVLEPGGSLVLLTPNISTYFTAALILLGRMPSSGPHPDSDALMRNEELFRVRGGVREHDAETDTPCHRHLVVFSYRVLADFLSMAGFSSVNGRGFGLYPFPNFVQPVLERIDPFHCHQMVFIARK
jgi:SAM-dependent methyltransferase